MKSFVLTKKERCWGWKIRKDDFLGIVAPDFFQQRPGREVVDFHKLLPLAAEVVNVAGVNVKPESMQVQVVGFQALL